MDKKRLGLVVVGIAVVAIIAAALQGAFSGKAVSGPYQENCVDTDGGVEPDVKGVVTYTKEYGHWTRVETGEDYCLDRGDTVREYYCLARGTYTSRLRTCASGRCENGACVN
jgi:hypothetical protein